jgi:hypothetical protein
MTAASLPPRHDDTCALHEHESKTRGKVVAERNFKVE